MTTSRWPSVRARPLRHPARDRGGLRDLRRTAGPGTPRRWRPRSSRRPARSSRRSRRRSRPRHAPGRRPMSDALRVSRASARTPTGTAYAAFSGLQLHQVGRRRQDRDRDVSASNNAAADRVVRRASAARQRDAEVHRGGRDRPGRLRGRSRRSGGRGRSSTTSTRTARARTRRCSKQHWARAGGPRATRLGHGVVT